MINNWNLPTSVSIAGVDWQIETNYKVIIAVLNAFNNPDYDSEEKILYMLISIIKDFDELPESSYEEAVNAVTEFIDMGIGDDKPRPRTMDWEQDASLIIPEINKQIGNGIDVRSLNMHWWTFLGYYMGIGESTFTHIINIRAKKAKNKPLEKWEKEFIKENKSLVELKKKLTKEEIEEKERLNKLLG